MTQAQMFNFEEEIDNQKINRKNRGYEYLVAAMDLPRESTEHMMDLYAKIAERKGTTAANVERLLRYVKNKSRQLRWLTNREMIENFIIKTFY